MNPPTYLDGAKVIFFTENNSSNDFGYLEDAGKKRLLQPWLLLNTIILAMTIIIYFVAM